MDEERSEGSVLLVDDEPGVLGMFRRVLAAHGFVVTTAANGREAIERFDEKRFDAVVSDVAMPGLDGIALLRAVRERDLDVPVVLVTGSPSVDSAAQAVEHGALRYLTKPVEIPDLVSTVANAVRLGRMARIKRQALEHLGDAHQQFGDRAGLEVALEATLGGLYIAYQPIVAYAERRVYAYEALMRSRDARLPEPGSVLDAAERLGRLHDLGRVIRSRIAATLAEHPDPLIFANLHPSDLLDEELYRPDTLLAHHAHRVVLEITERASLEHVPNVRERVSQLRKLGFRVAVDDIGAGYAGLSSIAHLEPEFMKIDMALVRNVDRDATRQKLVGAMVGLCREMEVEVVAEGIETVAERDTVVGLGCDLLQGFHFARPDAPFVQPAF